MKLFILLLSFFSYISFAGDFEKFLDSTTYYQKQRKFPEALHWAKKAYDYSSSNFKSIDSNNLNVLKNLSALYFYNSKFDSAIIYQKIHLETALQTLNELDERLSESMNNLAVFYQFNGNNPEAEKYFIKSLEKTRQIYKEDHPNLAKSIGNVAVFFKRTGKLVEAESLYTEAVEMSRRIYTEPHEELAKSLNNIAAFYIEISNFDLAEKYILESYEVYKGLFDENDDRLALVLNNLGTFYSNISKYKDATLYFEKALNIRRNFYKNDNHYLALSLLNLGDAYLKLNRYSEGLILLKESSEMFERIYPEQNDFVATAYLSYAEALFYSGKYKMTEDYVNKSIDIRKEKYNNKFDMIADAYNSKAFFLEQRGYYKKALQNYKKAYNTIKKTSIERKSYTITLLNNLGKMYYLLNDFSQSIKYYQRALKLTEEVFNDDHIEYIRTNSNIGVYYTVTGNFDMAEQYLKKAMTMNNNIFDNTSIHKISVLISYGFLYKQKGEYYTSLDYYNTALDELEQLHSERLNEEFRIKHNLNSLYLLTGNFKKAEKSINEVYQEFTKYFPKRNMEYLKILNQMINLYIEKDSNELVFKYLEESIDITYSIINDYFPVLSNYERSRFYSLFKEVFNLNNTFVLDNYSKNPEYAAFLLNKQINTKGLLLSTSTKFKNELSALSDTTLISLFNKWRDAKEFIARLYLKNNTELEKANINLDSVADYTNELEKELSQKTQSFESIKLISNIDFRDVQNMLNVNEAAVDIIKINRKNLSGNTSDTQYAALLLKKNSKYPEIVLLENGDELEKSKLAIYKKELMNDNEDKESYGNYWQHIASKLSGIEKVYISPDGIYNQINLNTLKNPVTEKYLFEELDVTILTNIREIIDLKKQNDIEHNSDFVFFGNPNFNYKFEVEGNDIFVESTAYLLPDSLTRGGLELYPLTHTTDEIKGITEILENRNYSYSTFLDTSATEERLKTIKKPRVLHLSTHGYFLKDINPELSSDIEPDITRFNENPLLRSMLFFTGSANTLNDSLYNRREDGILTALEAQNLDLKDTELAVLAACETGLGEIVSGEGVYGLQRAFIHAGAKSIIMSLWKANDKATKELMINFYKEWLGGKSKQQAFKSAQNIIREKFRYPYFWGAFIMVGE
jgi:CHAT domain-containing protein/Tfp pilus assembly protein PilF